MKRLPLEASDKDSKNNSVFIGSLAISSLREVHFLESLNHVNILKLKEVLLPEPRYYDRKDKKRDFSEMDPYRDSVFLLMEYCEHVNIIS